MMGKSGDDSEAANRLGLPIDLIHESEQFNERDSGVFPDNWKSYIVFTRMQTQWRVGMSGVTGLDYGRPLDRVMKAVGVPEDEEDDVFWGLQIMEEEYLSGHRQS